MMELSYGTHGTGQWGEQGSGTEVMVYQEGAGRQMRQWQRGYGADAMRLWRIERGYRGKRGNGNTVMEHSRGGIEGIWVVELSNGTHGAGQ